MEATRAPNASELTPVLLVNSDRVEWHEAGESGRVSYRFEPVEGEEPGAILNAVQRLLGARRASAILALGGGLVHEKLLELPALPRRELREVLLRKAAKLLQVAPSDTLFSAVPMGKGSAPADGSTEAVQRWFLLAARRSQLYRLRVGLRDAGLNVKRVVAARLARVCASLGARDVSEGACIVVDVEPNSVVTSLISSESVVNYSVLSGSLTNEPAMALSLVQEIKSFKAGWHKSSRGEEVSEIVVVGLPDERGRMLCHALRSAMPHARVALFAPPADPAGPEPFKLQAGAIASISACRGVGHFSPDLTLPIPWKLSRTLALAAAVTALLLIGAGVVKERVDDELSVLRAETAKFEHISSQIPDFGPREREADVAVLAVRAEAERAHMVAAVGFPVDDVLQEVIALFDANTALLSLQVRETARGQEIQLNGLVDPNPVVTKDALKRMRELLRESDRYSDVEIQIESSVGPGGASAGRTAEGGASADGRPRYLQFNLTAIRTVER